MEMQELSLVISNPEEGQFLQKIVWNRDEFMAMVSAIADEYRGLTYTDEQISVAKEDRARLNKAKKLISDKRIEVKKAITAPYDRFDKEIKEGVAKIDEVVSMIDGQIKEYEEGQKEEKKAKLQLYFNVCVGETDLPMSPQQLFDSLFDEKWLNLSVSLRKAQTELESKVNRVKKDLETISMLEAEYVGYANDVYARTQDISQAMNEVTRIRESKRRAEEERQRKEKEEAERRKREEEEQAAIRAAASQGSPAEDDRQEDVPWSTEAIEEPTKEDTAEEESKPHEASTKQEPVYYASFTVHGTREQIEGLKRYMIENDIRFEKGVR